MTALTQKASGRAALALGIGGAVILLLAMVFVPTASAVEPELVRNISGDACQTLGYDVEGEPFTIPRSGVSAYEESFSIDNGVTVTLTSPPNREYVDFVVTGAIVDGGILFNRDNQKLGNWYDYRPGGVTEGTLLPPPRDQGNDKKVVLCFNEKADPSLSTSATANAIVGGTISDTATLTGGDSPTGDVTFTLYSDQSCTTVEAIRMGTVEADGTATSGPYTTTAAGTYYWVASYPGDTKNNSVSGSCGDPGETSVVAKATPTLSTAATPTATVGDDISASATLGNGYNPTGTISFVIYSDDQCSIGNEITVLDPPADVTGNDEYGSGDYTTESAITHYWLATYEGDDNNEPASGTCDATGGTSVVGKATPSLTTVATQTAVIGDTISDAATLSSGYNAGGTISFSLYRDDQCSMAVATGLSPVDVTGDGTYPSGGYAVPPTLDAAGTYYWIASYSGDGNNTSVSGACGDEGEVTTVYEFNAKCGVPITRTDDSNANNTASFVRPEGSPGCNEPGYPDDDSDKFGSLGFFVSDGTPAVELLLSGEGEANAKFVGEVAFDTSGLTSIPIIKIDDDEDGVDNFRPMEWFTGATPTLVFDTSGNFSDADFSCPITENWCILEATISRDATTWKVGGLGVDPKWKF